MHSFTSKNILQTIAAVLLFLLFSCTDEEQRITKRISSSLTAAPSLLKDSFPEENKNFNKLTTDSARFNYLLKIAGEKPFIRNPIFHHLISTCINDSANRRFALLACLELSKNFEREMNSDSALWYYKTGIEAGKKSNRNLRELAALYRGLGRFYVKHSDYANGISNYNHAIILSDRTGDSLNWVTYLSEAGKIFYALSEIDKASLCFERAKEFSFRTKNYSLLVYSLNSLGDIKRVERNFTEAIRYHEEAQEANRKLTGSPFENWSSTSLGKIYTAINDFDKAEQYFNIVLEQAKNEKIADLESQAYLNLAQCDLKRGRIQSAIEKGEKAYASSLKLTDISLQSVIAKRLSDYYSKDKQFEKSLKYFRRYNELSDSVDNSVQVKKQVEAQFKFKEENLNFKMMQKEQLLKTEEEKRQLEANRHRSTIIFFVVVLFLMLAFSIITFINLQKNRKHKLLISAQKTMVEEQKAEIEKQKQLLENKQEEMMGSIHYALRIQNARMATEIYITRNLSRLKKKQKE